MYSTYFPCLNRGIFAAGNLPEAELLYDKAIAIKPDAVLFANRAAVRLGLNLTDSALADASKAIDLDPKYSKAYYRKGQAYNARKEYEAAVEAFEKGMELDPSNRTFRDCAIKAKAAAAKLAEEAAKTPSPPPPAAPATTTTTTTTTTSSSSLPSAAPVVPVSKKKKPKKKEGEAAGGSGEEDEDGEEEIALKAEAMRGYKVLEDGRKTTYFNNTLSEEAKRLIGDIAPKKIEVPAEGGGGGGGEGTAGSAWNYAGTFEERNMTEWATGRLQELLSEVRFPIPREGVGAGVEEGGAFVVKKVTGLEGDASVTFVRGKKKYLFDYVFTLEWEAGLAGGGKAKGTLKYPDVTPDNDDEYDTLLEVDQLTPPEARPLINAYIKSSSAGLQQVVREKLHQFMDDYQTF